MRRAYRMAILASLAYHDFRDDDDDDDDDGHHHHHHHPNGNERDTETTSRVGGGGSGNSSWRSFALVDDPIPSNYLAKMTGYDDDDEMTSTRGGIGTTSSSMERTRDKKGKWDRIRRISSGILDRFRVKLCQTRHGLHRLAIREMSSYSLVSPSLRPTNNDSAATSTTKDICKRRVRRTREGGKRYNVEWILSDWHETNANIRWHDTDLIIATSGTSDVVIAFAGTAGPADAVTSIQTLEPASHSGLFDRRWGGGGIDDATNSSTTATSPPSSSLEGNIHRGYLNAYARVMRGNIRRLEYDYHDDVVGGNRPSALSPKFFTTLDDYYNECMTMQGRMNASIDREDSFAITTKKTTNRNKKKRQTKKQRGGHQDMCRTSGYRLMDILRNVTTSALRSGRNVHIVGHSLAGALATIHALDVAMNYDSVTAPMDRLHLWTFGAPEMADSLFFESAGSISQRLRDFLGDPRRHHRYVTQSVKNCDTDVVASITSNALNRGRAVRRLGGVRGDVVHMNEPTFLLDNATGVELHELRTYLRGISHSSSSPHGLRTDFPSQVKSWLGENT
ncbi:hypothetical protein ACHAXA_005863 [Cyclostephanos tholiformis]|uniref:Fungal lipase-type domain-containing protein n=1 Tax=Cyclostephanos tholiformis TaxID=382380 RepID=A0ABD3RDA3_9STRA